MYRSGPSHAIAIHIVGLVGIGIHPFHFVSCEDRMTRFLFEIGDRRLKLTEENLLVDARESGSRPKEGSSEYALGSMDS